MRLVTWFLAAAWATVACHCGQIRVNEYSFGGELKDAKWAGTNQAVMLILNDDGTVHRSVDKGASFENIADQLSKAAAATETGDIKSIFVHPKDPSVVYLTTKAKSQFVSRDGGRTWDAFMAPAEVDTIAVHPTDAKHLLLSGRSAFCGGANYSSQLDDSHDRNGNSACYKTLYHSSDSGATFTLVTKYVVQFDWAERLDQVKEDEIQDLKGVLENLSLATEAKFLALVSLDENQIGNQRFGYWSPTVNLYGVLPQQGERSKTLLVRGGNQFIFSRNLLFVAQVQLVNGRNNVGLELSSDRAKSFYTGSLPFDLAEESYTVLDTTEGVVFLHVNHKSIGGLSSGTGIVYVSDSTGMNFTFSLRDNARAANGICDFDKVLSIEGVYIANFVSNPEALGEETGGQKLASGEPKLRSVISFDRGGEWGLLSPPTVDSLGQPVACSSKSCSLHLHGHQRQGYAPVYSTPNAVGLVMGIGNVGDHLLEKQGDLNTFLSRDGGLTWSEVRKGSYIFEIGNHGGLIAMAKDSEKTNQLVYSWTQGKEWTEIAFTREPMEVDNIIIEPSATSRIFHVYGFKPDSKGNSVGTLVTVDFSDAMERECTGSSMPKSSSSDYELWSPRDVEGGSPCHLGHQVEYTRRKQFSSCYTPTEFEAHKFVRNCPCTDRDYECDFGYYRKSRSGPCERDLQVTDSAANMGPPKTCPSSGFYSVSNGYRLVGGNTCVGGKNLGATTYSCSRGFLGISPSAWLVLVCMLGLVFAMTYNSMGGATQGFLSAKGRNVFGAQKFGEDAEQSCFQWFLSLLKDPQARQNAFRNAYSRVRGGAGGQGEYDPESMLFDDEDFAENGGDDFDVDGDEDSEEPVEKELIPSTSIAKPLPPARSTTSEAAHTSISLKAPPKAASTSFMDHDDFGDDV